MSVPALVVPRHRKWRAPVSLAPTPSLTLSIALSIALASACGEGELLGGPGLRLDLRVDGGELARGSIPAPAGGPAITAVEVPQPRVVLGTVGHPVRGRAAAGSFTVRLQLRGDRNHWIVPVGLPDDVVRDELQWAARLSFSALAAPGATVVEVQASDGAGRGGPLTAVPLTLVEDEVTGDLVVGLEWDRDVDFDLHVIDAAGVHVGPKNINAYEPPAPGEPPDPGDAWQAGARLDFDSNASCVIDGRRLERIVWPTPPAPGTVRVFVDLFATCGEPRASFRVVARRRGELVAEGFGSMTRDDALLHPLPPGTAPGLLVAELAITGD